MEQHRKPVPDQLWPGLSVLAQCVQQSRLSRLFSGLRQYLQRAAKVFTLAYWRRNNVSLYTLPTELLLHINDFLPKSSILVPRRTCRRFYYCYSPNIEDLFDRIHSLSESPERLQDQKFFKECLGPGQPNEMTSDPSLGLCRQFCSACRMDHHVSEFSMATSREPGYKRQCMKHEGLLWICPFTEWSFDELTATDRHPACDLCSSGHTTHLAESHPQGLCKCKQHFVAIFDGHLVQAYPIKIFESKASMTSAIVTAMLESIHVRVCPHLSVNDPKVSEWCERTYGMYAFQCNCRSCRRAINQQFRACGLCDTHNGFRHGMVGGKVVLYLWIRKCIHHLDDIDSKRWKALLFLPSEIKRLKEEQECAKLCQIEDQSLREQVLSWQHNPYVHEYTSWW